ncbi:hypothetical protein BKA67DRAFT_641087 [Truncatella angustata]|uniref:Uncharacterized protein n=1 Tax=Truncatella angustata TaxID=152316 RepID=A0A9P9A2Y9_9PEZI|nr:uncharacterized protein BKA67DRAFT_641087 [Truncatella angustata]KAH6659912.1 hypothetical protein BKA67DRAFT_641087 [Truncatella angustata]
MDVQLVHVPRPPAGEWADRATIAGWQGSLLLILPLGGQELASFSHNELQRAVLALPGRDILVVNRSITPAQVVSHRPSYINFLLITSRGRVSATPCVSCRLAAALSPFGWARPSPVCVRLPGHFGGCCSNCKWKDQASRCSVRDGVGTPFPSDDNDNDNDNDTPPPRQRALPAHSGSQDDPNGL